MVPRCLVPVSQVLQRPERGSVAPVGPEGVSQLTLQDDSGGVEGEAPRMCVFQSTCAARQSRPVPGLACDQMDALRHHGRTKGLTGIFELRKVGTGVCKYCRPRPVPDGLRWWSEAVSPDGEAACGSVPAAGRFRAASARGFPGEGFERSRFATSTYWGCSWKRTQSLHATSHAGPETGRTHTGFGWV